MRKEVYIFMEIFVDADACPVVHQVESVAQKYQVSVVLLCDTNHILSSDYSKIRVVGAGADAVDFALINLCHAGDIVVTQDYGVAALALGKHAYAVHQNGWQYTDKNIDRLLMERHIMKRHAALPQNFMAKGHISAQQWMMKTLCENSSGFCKWLLRRRQRSIVIVEGITSCMIYGIPGMAVCVSVRAVPIAICTFLTGGAGRTAAGFIVLERLITHCSGIGVDGIACNPVSSSASA